MGGRKKTGQWLLRFFSWQTARILEHWTCACRSAPRCAVQALSRISSRHASAHPETLASGFFAPKPTPPLVEFIRIKEKAPLVRASFGADAWCVYCNHATAE